MFTQNLRYAVRLLLRNPGFTAIAALTIALGIAASTLIFSIVNAALLRPLPYRDPDRLAWIWQNYPKRGWTTPIPFSWPNFRDLKETNESFEQVGAFTPFDYNLTGIGDPESIQGLRVTAGLFPVLGVQPLLGRVFLDDEETPGRDRVVVLSHGLWKRRFGGDRDVLGRTVQLNGQDHTIIAIMPPAFRFPPPVAIGKETFSLRAELWTPLAIPAANPPGRGTRFLVVAARLKPSATLAQAQAESRGLARRLEQAAPGPNTGLEISVTPLREQVVGNIRPVLLVLSGAVAFVLLIACANVANMLLARSIGRQKEFAIRAALGAGRWRLVRQTLIESLAIALPGGGLGFLITAWTLDPVAAMGLSRFPSIGEIRIDFTVAAFSLAITLLTALIFGCAPALHSSKIDLNDALKEAGRVGHGGERSRALRNLLVVSEIALAFMLLIGAGLMARSFLNLMRTGPGFDPSRLLAAKVVLPPAKYSDTSRRAEFHRSVVERLQALPGVQSASLVESLPFGGEGGTSGFDIETRPAPSPNDRPHASFRPVSGGYFRTIGIPLVKGRFLQPQDYIQRPAVAVINEAAGRRYWPNEDPIGARISTDYGNLTIAGIVGDVKHSALDAKPEPEIYVPFLGSRSANFVLRTTLDPESLGAAVRGEIRALDSELPVLRLTTMNELISESVTVPRLYVVLFGAFGALAIAMAAAGIYGIVSYLVSRRIHELGVRIALGASQTDVLTVILVDALKLTVAGLSIGLAGAAVLTRFLATRLYNLSPIDPLTFALVSLFLLGTALLASYLPARRAMKVDPMAALRWE